MKFNEVAFISSLASMMAAEHSFFYLQQLAAYKV